MPAIPPEKLVEAITNALSDSGVEAQFVSPVRRQPRRFILAGQNVPLALTIYAWTLTPGGRPSLRDEYRIQMTSVSSPLTMGTDGPTILVGYDSERNLFAGFDLERHSSFTTGSPSVQIDINELRKAETAGLSFHRKSNDEIAIGIRSDMLLAYAMNARLLHRFGTSTSVLRLLNQSLHSPVPQPAIENLSVERRRVISEVNRLSRDASFRQRVLFAYGNKCAVTRIQLKLVEAAHILPVGASGSADHVTNGLALSPTYHRAYDAGLIYLDENYRMRLNEGRLQMLNHLNLAGGVDSFRAPLGEIFLPPDPQQRPSIDFIRRANQVRHI